MDCHPECVLPLPQIGTARIKTLLRLCVYPPELQIITKHDVQSTSLFKAQASEMKELRNIGTEHWPMTLDVDFYKIEDPMANNVYRIQACIVSERINKMTCFINNTLHTPAPEECDHPGSSATPIFLLSILLAIFFMTLAIGMVVVVHRLYSRYSQFKAKRNRKFAKPQNCAQLLPSHQSQKFDIEDDRLTVIEEERESETEDEGQDMREGEKDHWLSSRPTSPNSEPSSGIGSSHDVEDMRVPSLFPANIRQPHQTTISMVGHSSYRPSFQTFRPLAQEV